MTEEYINIIGDVVAIEELQVPKAREFARFLALAGPEVFAELHETKRTETKDGEIVILSVEVERPQNLTYDIRRKELLAVTFWAADNQVPEVLSLRWDFPKVPHINLREKELPRSLCLYDQPYEQVRVTWTPADFLGRIRFWLAKTSEGTLHGEDQHLEPYLSGSGVYLILPSDFWESAQKARSLDVFPCGKNDKWLTFRAKWQDSKAQQQPDHIAAVFICLPQVHGVIRRRPANLGELHALCLEAGLDLLAELKKTIQKWHVNKPHPSVLAAKLIIIIAIPKSRYLGAPIEAVDKTAFLTGKTVEAIGIELGVIQKHGANAGYIIGGRQTASDSAERIPVDLLQVVNALSPNEAAKLNGCPRNRSRTVAIGMGALGSQIFDHLIRAGFGQWTLIDDDLLLPHNCTRHILGDWAVGSNKAQAMALMANSMLDGEPIANAIPANFLMPGRYAQAIDDAMNASDLVLDSSASIPVARDLASRNTKARAICAFLTPKGDGLIVAAEDRKRRVRLDWIEMLHYRAILHKRHLRDSLQSDDAGFRYGNSCRDVSFRLAQDDVAIWSGAASKAIKTLQSNDRAALDVYKSNSDGGIEVFHQPVTSPLRLTLSEWTIMLDRWLLRKMARLRKKRLPNETGGVLIGGFDTQRHTCMLVEILPSPPDSREWPTSYIRGCEGLVKKVREIKSLTLGQLRYVGEWHSHPDGFSTSPSPDDLVAYSWLVSHMQFESLPGIMLILGENLRFDLVNTEPKSK
jgi:hypothetical protein